MDRDAAIRTIETEAGPWDVLVVGGGATGLGAALDAVSRGYRTLLLERGDFAEGTSSRSTKLIHGGVRYLAQGRIGLVRESLTERSLLLRNAPDLVQPLSFLVPAYSAWDRAAHPIAFWIYDRLAGRGNGLAASRRISREEARRRFDSLPAERLRGAVVFEDARFDDARLALALARKIHELGGVALNYVRVDGFLREGERVSGVRATDLESGRGHELRARVVINAAGPFAGDLRRRAGDAGSGAGLVLSRGSHLVLGPEFVRGSDALLVPHTPDGRVIFAIPWQGSLLVGTTDVPVEDPDPDPVASPAEVDYLLRQIGPYLSPPPSRRDVRSVFAGIRPLVGGAPGEGAESSHMPGPNGAGRGGSRGTAGISREHRIEAGPPGLLNVFGGKWTTYRRMGEEAVDRALELAGLPILGSRTRDLPLGSAPDRGSGSVLHPRLPIRPVDVERAVREEMARTVSDVLARRTRCLFLDAAASVEAAETVGSLLGSELGRSRDWVRDEVRRFRALAARYAC